MDHSITICKKLQIIPTIIISAIWTFLNTYNICINLLTCPYVFFQQIVKKKWMRAKHKINFRIMAWKLCKKIAIHQKIGNIKFLPSHNCMVWRDNDHFPLMWYRAEIGQSIHLDVSTPSMRTPNCGCPLCPPLPRTSCASSAAA